MDYIAISGNIASGKTTLCKGMAKYGYRSIFEDFDKNPFFNDFYDDPEAYSFETEITFLLQHYHLIKKQKNNSLLVCDYSLLLDLAYADVNLSGQRLKIFIDIVEELHKEIDLPKKIIYLICPEEVLLQRIIDRSREAESAISLDYLTSLSKAISKRIREFSHKVPVTTIDSHAIDFRSGIEKIKEKL